MEEELDVEPDSLPRQILNEPPQHPDVRRKIRIQYRTLLNDVASECHWRAVISLMIYFGFPTMCTIKINLKGDKNTVQKYSENNNDNWKSNI